MKWAEHALEVALAELRRRIESSEPRKLEAQRTELDEKIARALDLAIELGDMDVAKERLRDLKAQREATARELARARTDLPTAEELMPRVREKLHEIEATLRSDIASGRLALGALLGDRKLRVYADGRIEGAVELAAEELPPLEPVQKRREGAASVVAGGAIRPIGYGENDIDSADALRLVSDHRGLSEIPGFATFAGA